MSNYFDLEQKALVRKVNSAVINVSGRQRMLSQRAALYALRLVNHPHHTVRRELQAVADLMARSHKGLIYGDATLKLAGKVSPTVHQIYFAPPYQLDAQVQEFLAAAQALAQANDADLTFDNPHLQHLLDASENRLLKSLDHVVSQYQAEAEAQAIAIDEYQASLYQQAKTAQHQAQMQAQQLRTTLTKLQNTQQQLIHAEKMSSLGQLVAGIAHEVNNPLSFIYGNLHYIQDYVQELQSAIATSQTQLPTVLPADKVEELDFIRQDLPKLLKSMYIGSQRIKAIVEGLRNFSRLDESSLKQAMLYEGIESTLIILQHRLEHTPRVPIQIQRLYPPQPLEIECFPGQLNQVFMNLLSNAIDALEEAIAQRTDPWQPQITIEISRLNSEFVQVEIRDNGLGIPAEIQSQIFNPFFTTKPIGAGTGLGLSISHQIVTDVHRGQLLCTSNPATGTTFTLTLPIQLSQRHYDNLILWPHTAPQEAESRQPMIGNS